MVTTRWIIFLLIALSLMAAPPVVCGSYDAGVIR